MVAAARRTRATGFLLFLWAIVTCLSCTSPDVAPEAADPDTWPIHRVGREQPGEEIGEITLTDPVGGPPRPANIGTHGIRIALDVEAGEAGVPDEAGATGETGAEGEGAAAPEVRVVYSRQGSADTRAFVAVRAPSELGVYLGTVDLVAAGEWRIRVSIVGGSRGSAQITVPEN